LVKVGEILPVYFRISLQQAQISAYLQLEDNPPVNLQFNKVNTEPGQPKIQQRDTEPTGQLTQFNRVNIEPTGQPTVQ
jgi:hypothetical protein